MAQFHNPNFSRFDWFTRVTDRRTIAYSALRSTSLICCSSRVVQRPGRVSKLHTSSSGQDGSYCDRSDFPPRVREETSITCDGEVFLGFM